MAFISSVVGKCLHNIYRMGGKVVYVTTDGLITDIQDMEYKLFSFKTGENTFITISRFKVWLELK